MTLPYELLAAESRIAPKTRRPRGARYVDFVKKHGVYIHICMYVSTWNTRSGESKCARARVCVCVSFLFVVTSKIPYGENPHASMCPVVRP